MKSNFFDINRFGLLLRKRLIDSQSSIIFELLGLAAVFAIFLGLAATSGSISDKSQIIIFSIGFAVLGVIYADRAFSETKSSVKGVFYLSTPASQFEKLLVGILFTSVLFPLVYVVVFLMVDGLFYMVLNGTGLVAVDSVMRIESAEITGFVRPMLVIQSVFMLGSIWFRKRSLLKTVIVVVGFYALLGLVGVLMLSSQIKMLNGGVNVNVGTGPADIVGGAYGNVIFWLLPLFFWTVAYFRLAEKQL